MPRSSAAKTASSEATSSTSQGSDSREPETFGERAHALAQRLALIGEGELGALGGERLGDAPGDRMVVGDAHHEAALAAHQARFHPAHFFFFVRRRRA